MQRENMPSERIQKHTAKRSRLSDSLNSRRWRFLQSGLDDFRCGFPPLCDQVIVQPMERSDPVILPGIKENLSRKQPKPRQMLRKKPQSLVSKLSPMRATRREWIADTEYGLTQHPLVLYPHLQESVPLELFKEVVHILDPNMLPISEEVDTEIELDHCILPTIQSQLEKKRTRQKRSRMTSWKGSGGKDPYTWFSKKEVAAREREAKMNYIPPLGENVKQATKELCSWLHSLGGEKYNLDEDGIISLFDVNYETKRPGSLPVNVVALNDLPIELQQYAGISPLQLTMKRAAQQGRSSKESCHMRLEKIRYGAWSLEPKTWKRVKAKEPLEDPNPKDTRIKNSNGPFDGKDTGVMQLHGTHAFKTFLEGKGYHIPEFLSQMLAEEQSPVRPKCKTSKALPE